MITVHVFFCLSFTNIYLLIDIVQLPIQVSILRLRWKPIRLSLKQILSSFCKIVRQEKPVEKQDSSSWFDSRRKQRKLKKQNPTPVVNLMDYGFTYFLATELIATLQLGIPLECCLSLQNALFCNTIFIPKRVWMTKRKRNLLTFTAS